MQQKRKITNCKKVSNFINNYQNFQALNEAKQRKAVFDAKFAALEKRVKSITSDLDFETIDRDEETHEDTRL